MYFVTKKPKFTAHTVLVSKICTIRSIQSKMALKNHLTLVLGLYSFTKTNHHHQQQKPGSIEQSRSKNLTGIIGKIHILQKKLNTSRLFGKALSVLHDICYFLQESRLASVQTI